MGYYSNEDEPLNEKGIAQAIELSDKLKNIDYDIVYCSPLERARQTVEIINKADKMVLYNV